MSLKIFDPNNMEATLKAAYIRLFDIHESLEWIDDSSEANPLLAESEYLSAILQAFHKQHGRSAEEYYGWDRECVAIHQSGLMISDTQPMGDI